MNVTLAITTTGKANPRSIQLQGVGCIIGTPASELKIGSTMIWNFGATSEVVDIIKETKAFITFRTKTEENGVVKYWERKLKKTRIVGRPTNEL